MNIIYIIVVQSCVCSTYIHKLNRLYSYNTSESITFNCQKIIEAFIYVSSTTRLEIHFNNITQELNPSSSEHFIKFMPCQTEIFVKSSKPYSIIQGEVYYEELNHYDQQIIYDLYTGILFFHFIVTEQLLSTITIKLYLELLSSYYIILYENKVGQVSIRQFQYYDNYHYNLLEKGEYILMIAGPQNLEFTLNLQTQIVSQNFLYVTQTTTNNLYEENEIRFGNVSYMLIKPLLGTIQLKYEDDPQIIELSINHVIFVAKEFKILVSKDPVVLFTKPHQGIFIFSENPIYCFMYKNSTQYLQILTPIYIKVHTKSCKVTKLQSLYFHNYILYDLVIDNLENSKNTLVQLDVSFKALEVDPLLNQNIQIDTNSSLILQGNDIDIQTIQGKYEIKDLGSGQELLLAHTFINIHLRPMNDQICNRINLHQVYKFRKSDLHHCLITEIQIQYIKVYVFPTNLVFNIQSIFRVDKQQQINLDILQSSSNFYYVFLAKIGPEIIDKKDSIKSLLPTMLYNSSKFQIFKAYQNQSVNIYQDKSVYKVVHIQDNLSFLVRYYTNYSIQLFPDTLSQLKNDQNYIILIDVNIISFEIVSTQDTYSLLINVQCFDSNKQVHFPQANQFSDFAYFNQTSIILNLELYDCLVYDCILKLSAQHNSDLLQLKYKKCNSYSDIDEIYFEFNFQLLFCETIHYSEIIILQGSVTYTADYQLYTCITNHCAVIIANQEILMQIQLKLPISQYILTINGLVEFKDLQYTRQLLIVNQEAEFFMHTNTQLSISDVMNQSKELLSENSKLSLKKGIYLFQFHSVNIDSYITIFTSSTILYEKILFQIQTEECFIVDNSIYEFLVIQFREIINFKSIQLGNYFINRLPQSDLSLQILNNNSLLRLSGQFKFSVHYTNNPCFLITAPTTEITNRLSNSTKLSIKLQINEECFIETIRMKYNNASKFCRNQECILILDYVSVQLTMHYELFIQSRDYEYIFRYSVDLDIKQNTNNEILKVALIFIVFIFIYSILQDQIQFLGKANKIQKQDKLMKVELVF